MTDQCDRIETQSVAKSGRILAEGLDGIVPIGRPVRFPSSALVDGNDTIGLAKLGRDVIPGVRVPSESVEKHHGKATGRTPFQAAQRDAAHGYAQ